MACPLLSLLARKGLALAFPITSAPKKPSKLVRKLQKQCLGSSRQLLFLWQSEAENT